MSTQEIKNNLKLLRQPELEKFKQFIISSDSFPPKKPKLLREFMSFAPDKNEDNVYKTHVYITLLEIWDKIQNNNDRLNFVKLIDEVTPDDSKIDAIIKNKNKEKENKEKEYREYQQRIEGLRQIERKNIAKERDNIAEEGSNSETNNPLAQARKEAETKEAEARATEAVRREAERKEAEARARREATERARREATERARREATERARREAEEKARREAEAKARREAEERAKKQAEAMAKRARKEVKENAQRATNKAYIAAQRAREGSLKHPLRNPPKPPTQRFVPPNRSNRIQKKPENLNDFEVFKQYYERFCNIYNHTILDDQSLQSNFELLNSKQYQKFKTKNGYLQEDNNKINEVEFKKFLKHQNCLVDDKDPLFLALREFRLFNEFKKNFKIIKETSNKNNYQNITDIQLRETFDSFRRGDFKISYQNAKQYKKKVVDDYLNGLGSSYNYYNSEEHERINKDEIFFAYNLVKVAYLSTTSNEDHWQNILSSIENAKSHLSKLSEELKGIKLPELPQFTLPKIQLSELNQESDSHITSGLNKFQDIVKFFESLSNQSKAPTSEPVMPSKPISRANSWSPKNINVEQKPSAEVRKPRGRNIDGKIKIAYFGPKDKELQEKHKKAMENKWQILMI